MNHNIEKRLNGISCIYQIRNLVNGKIYVGSTKNINHRLITHKSRLKSNKHANSHLQSAYNKYGADSFLFKPLLICDNNNLLYYEQIIIDILKPEYNMAKYVLSPMKDRKHSEKTKELMRSYHTAETRYPGFEYSWAHPHNKGKPKTKEIKEKIRNSLLGRSVPQSVKDKIGKSHLGMVMFCKTLRGELISPDGETYKDINNMQKFAKEHNLDRRRLSDFNTGRYTHYKGWYFIPEEV